MVVAVVTFGGWYAMIHGAGGWWAGGAWCAAGLAPINGRLVPTNKCKNVAQAKMGGPVACACAACQSRNKGYTPPRPPHADTIPRHDHADTDPLGHSGARRLLVYSYLTFISP